MDGIANSLLKLDYYYCFLVEICVILWFAKQIRVTLTMSHLIKCQQTIYRVFFL
uniref:Uncharacterized protein n=1 Tax=Uncultured archaeon GZfos26G2 TaxID=3386331 RepID=Q64AZ1_UNCAG|nr:hypothetical protein GZ28B8_32 [uncultured archaeon GZfos28B8]